MPTAVEFWQTLGNFMSILLLLVFFPLFLKYEFEYSLWKVSRKRLIIFKAKSWKENNTEEGRGYDRGIESKTAGYNRRQINNIIPFKDI